jgi:hypothetical protein
LSCWAIWSSSRGIWSSWDSRSWSSRRLTCHLPLSLLRSDVFSLLLNRFSLISILLSLQARLSYWTPRKSQKGRIFDSRVCTLVVNASCFSLWPSKLPG